MRLTVTPQPLATAVLDVAVFARLFRPAFDLDAAVRGSVRVAPGPADPADVLAAIHHGLDWSNFLLLWPTLPPRIDIKVHRVLLEGFTVYHPGVIDPAAHTFETEDRVVDKETFLLVHTGNQRLDKHLEYMMAQTLIAYGDQEWTVLFDADAPR